VSTESRLRYIRTALSAFVADTRGQDLVEYGLLTGIVASGLFALIPSLLTRLQGAFIGWGDARNNLWVPLDPAP
jgi:Flp pilus assembly pilin Flp